MNQTPDPTGTSDEVESFRGRIYLLQDGQAIPLRFSRSSDRFDWGITPGDDWLQAGGDQDSPVLQFTYHSRSEGRLNFMICGTGSQAGKRLGISRNGYLGLYQHAEVVDYWKIEPLEVSGEDLICRWRDHLGHQVKTERDVPHHAPGVFYLLTVAEGEIHQYLIRRVA